MAGSKTKKVRGLKAKNWAWLEFLLNRTERGLILGKLGGSLEKTLGADRYLPQLTRVGFVSGCPMEIVRLRAFGRAGGGAGSRRRASTAAGSGACAGLHLVRCSGHRFDPTLGLE